MAFYDTENSANRVSLSLAPVNSLLERIQVSLAHFGSRSKQAADLRKLTDTQLCDIGKTRAEANAEADRLSWTPPIWMRGQ